MYVVIMFQINFMKNNNSFHENTAIADRHLNHIINAIIVSVVFMFVMIAI